MLQQKSRSIKFSYVSDSSLHPAGLHDQPTLAETTYQPDAAQYLEVREVWLQK